MAELSPAKVALLNRWRAGTWRTSAPQLEPRADPVGPPVASRYQQRHWHGRSAGTDGSARAIGFFGRFDLPVDADAFAEAVRRIAHRQEVLRTGLDERDGVVVQVIQDDPLVDSGFVDLTGSGDAAASIAHDDARREVGRAFDLRRGPVAAVKLYRLTATDHAVMVAAHHVCADGWSLGVAVAELEAAYASVVTGRPSALPPPPVTYADFAAWQAAWVESAECARAGAWWRSRLEGWRAARVPADGDPTARPGVAAHLDVVLPDDLVLGVRRMATATGVPVFAALLAAFTLVLSERADATDIGIYLGTANRDRPETHPLIGLFATGLAVPVPVDRRRTFAEHAGRVHQDVMAATARQDVDLPLYLSRFEPGRDLREAPLTTACVGFQPPLPELRFGGAVLVPYELPTTWTNRDGQVSLHLYNDRFGIRGRLQYEPAVTAPAVAEALCARFQHLVAVAAARPSESLDRIAGAP